AGTSAKKRLRCLPRRSSPSCFAAVRASAATVTTRPIEANAAALLGGFLAPTVGRKPPDKADGPKMGGCNHGRASSLRPPALRGGRLQRREQRRRQGR